MKKQTVATAAGERREAPIANRVKVLIFEPYPNPQAYGNMRTLSYILRFTDPDRFHMTVAIPFESEFRTHAERLGAKCVLLEAPARLNKYGGQLLRARWDQRIRSMLDLLAYNVRLSTFFRRNGYDVVYCNCIRAVLTVGLAARLAGAQVILAVNGELQNPILDFISIMLANRVLFLAASNRDDRYPWLIRRMRRKIDVLRIGIDAEEVRAAEQGPTDDLVQRFALDRDDLKIAYLGQLYAPKGVNFLIEAFGRIAEDIPNSRLFIIGDPGIDAYRDYPGELRELAASLGLADRVVFTGWVPDAPRLLTSMDLLVHPSLSEGFGRSVLEAMALRLPVIATRVGGLREAIRDGENGMLVEPRDVGALADRLAVLLRDSALRARLGRSAKETVFSEYLIIDKIRSLSETFEELAGSARAR